MTEITNKPEENRNHTDAGHTTYFQKLICEFQISEVASPRYNYKTLFSESVKLQFLSSLKLKHNYNLVPVDNFSRPLKTD